MKEQTRKIREAVKLLSSFTEEEWKLLDRMLAKEDSKTNPGGKKDIEKVVTDMLRHFRVPPNVKGHKYLREAIIWKIKNPENAGITKDIYPIIAKNHGDTVSKVERAMRHAIELACKDAPKELFVETLGIEIPPTNSEFVYGIADYIQIYIL